MWLLAAVGQVSHSCLRFYDRPTPTGDLWRHSSMTDKNVVLKSVNIQGGGRCVKPASKSLG